MARGGTKNGKDNSQNNLDPNYVPSGAPGLAPSFSSEPSDDLVSIREQVDQVPTNPGCYLWKDGSGKVIYVGKAKNLRARMRQYVTLQDDRAKIPLMMQVVRSFDYIVVENEHEALVLERNLIAQYRPYFNVDFKDDKSYPYIAITESDTFPAIKYTREKHKKGTRYFGPYTDSYAARQTIETLRKVVPICSATCVEWKRAKRLLEKDPDGAAVANLLLAKKGRPCFDYHVGKGPGVCVGAIDTVSYAKNVRQVENFLRGNRSEIVSELKDQMQEAAADLDFEKAARLKSRLTSLSDLDDRQQVTFPTSVNIDLIGIYREETISAACVFVVREGRTIRSVEFILDKGLDVSEEELVSGFLKRYYDETADIPAEVNLPIDLLDAEVLSEWLTQKRGHNCVLHHPQRGEKFRLLQMASANARHALMRHMIRTGYADDRTNQALLQLKSQYRRFKIRAELDEANDFVSMTEVLGRRYSPERMADERFGSRPDLLVVDGGKPQLTAAINQLNELGLDIPVCGLAKSDEEVFVPWDDTPIVLPTGSASLYLIKQVRDESHRFAITFHRELRDKAMTVSILDEIPGVGPKRKKDIMRHFGSFKRLKAASVEDISQVKGVSVNLAETIYEELKAWEESSTAVHEKVDAREGTHE